MSDSAKKAKEYADDLMAKIGDNPSLSTGLLRMALEIAYQAGFMEGDIEAAYRYFGITEKIKEKENDKI